MTVIITIAKNGISSAKNLHNAVLSISGIGITDTKIAHPIKKMIDFNDTSISFFISLKLLDANLHKVHYTSLCQGVESFL